MSFHSAPWARTGACMLADEVGRLVAALPHWLHEEPEWTRLGFLPADDLRALRTRMATQLGIHAYQRIKRAAVVDPDLLLELMAPSRLPDAVSPSFLGAACIYAEGRPSELPLFLLYLSRFERLTAEDVYDLIGLWGEVESRVNVLMRCCCDADTRIATTALLALSANEHRGFVRGELPALVRQLSAQGSPSLWRRFEQLFLEAGGPSGG